MGPFCVFAVCCSVLQCVAVCCSVLQCVAVCCSVLQYVAACCSVDMNPGSLHTRNVAVCCSVCCSASWHFEIARDEARDVDRWDHLCGSQNFQQKHTIRYREGSFKKVAFAACLTQINLDIGRSAKWPSGNPGKQCTCSRVYVCAPEIRYIAMQKDPFVSILLYTCQRILLYRDVTNTATHCNTKGSSYIAT